MSTTITFRRGTAAPTQGTGLTLGEPAFDTTNRNLYVGLGSGVTAAWVGARISGLSSDITAGLTNWIMNAKAIKDYVNAVTVTPENVAFVDQANTFTEGQTIQGNIGLTVQTVGASDAVAISPYRIEFFPNEAGIQYLYGSSTSGNKNVYLPDASGTLALTSQLMGTINGSTAATTAVTSFNGKTGAVTGASLGANTFSGLQISATGFSGPLTGNVTGNASTATKLADARGFSLSGDIIASAVNFDGSANVTLVTSIATGSIVNADINNAAAIAVTKLAENKISGVTLGNNLNTLTIGSGLGGGSYNGSSAVTITNNGVTSFNGLTGAVGGVCAAVTNTFTAAQTFNGGITASQVSVSGNSTLSGNVSVGLTLTVGGNLIVNGTTTTINSTTISVDDKNIVLADINTPSDTAADGGGITLKGNGDKNLYWKRLGGSLAAEEVANSWNTNQDFNLTSATGKYYVEAYEVLSKTALGSTVVSSSLTSVGTITSGTWNSDIVYVDGGSYT